VAQILDVKVIRSRRFAVAAGSTHNLTVSSGRRNPSMQVFPAGNPDSRRSRGPIDIVGYTCMENDVLYREYEGPLAAGDFVAFDVVGAYSVVMKPPFIAPLPPILAVDGEIRDADVVKRAEGFADIFGTYAF